MESEDSCEDKYCICVHYSTSDPNFLDIYIHSLDIDSNRTMSVDKKDILSERVLKFLNADAYDFIREVKKVKQLRR